MEFFRYIANMLQKFLAEFQTDKRMVAFLFSAPLEFNLTIHDFYFTILVEVFINHI